MVVVIFLIIYRAHVNVLSIIKVKIFLLIKRSYRTPPIMLIIECRMVTFLKHVVEALLNTYLFLGISCRSTSDHIPLKGVRLRYVNCIRHIYLLCLIFLPNGVVFFLGMEFNNAGILGKTASQEQIAPSHQVKAGRTTSSPKTRLAATSTTPPCYSRKQREASAAYASTPGV